MIPSGGLDAIATRRPPLRHAAHARPSDARTREDACAPREPRGDVGPAPRDDARPRTARCRLAALDVLGDPAPMTGDRGLLLAVRLAGAGLLLNVASDARPRLGDRPTPPTTASSRGACSVGAGIHRERRAVPSRARSPACGTCPSRTGSCSRSCSRPLFALLGESPAVLRLPGLAFAALSACSCSSGAGGSSARRPGSSPALLTLTNVALAYFGVIGTDDVGLRLLPRRDAGRARPRARHAQRTRLPGRGHPARPSRCSRRRAASCVAGILLAVALFPPRPRAPGRSSSSGRRSWPRWACTSSATYLAHGSLLFRISPLDWYLRARRLRGHDAALPGAARARCRRSARSARRASPSSSRTSSRSSALPCCRGRRGSSRIRSSPSRRRPSSRRSGSWPRPPRALVRRARGAHRASRCSGRPCCSACSGTSSSASSPSSSR